MLSFVRQPTTWYPRTTHCCCGAAAAERRQCSAAIDRSPARLAQRRAAAARWDRQTERRADERKNARQSLETIQCTEIIHRIIRAGDGLSQVVAYILVYRTSWPSAGDCDDDDDGDGEADCCDDVGSSSQRASSVRIRQCPVIRRHCTRHRSVDRQSALARLTPNRA